MKRLFTKSFFKLTAGFMSIVAVAVLIVLVAGSFEVKEESQASIDVTVDEI